MYILDKNIFGLNFWIKNFKSLISVDNFDSQIWITFLDKIYYRVYNDGLINLYCVFLI